MKGLVTILAIFGFAVGYINAAVIQGPVPVDAIFDNNRDETHLFDESDYVPATRAQIENWIATKLALNVFSKLKN